MEDIQSTSGVRTWIEIDTHALKNNIAEFKKLIAPTVKFCGVVKSNAYGHGLVDFSKAIADAGADWLAVDSLVEGLRLRKEGITKPILVLGYTLPEMMEKAVDADISITLSQREYFSYVEKLPAGKKIKAHLKIDSGMHRQGFLETEVSEIIVLLKKHTDNIKVEGMYTHFAAAKNPAFPQATKNQISIFNRCVEMIKTAGFSPLVHASATSGTILFPEAHYDMVRIGIGLYGLWPSTETKAFAEQNIKLLPVMSWKTIMGEVKRLAKGEKVGYDFTEELVRDSVVAICPIGYWHGFPRALSAIGKVLVGGVQCKVLGRVAMDMIIVDITDVKNPVVGAETAVIGRQGNEYIGAEDIARLNDASWY